MILSCNNNNPINPNNTNEFAYPLKIGNQWEYNRTFSIFNIRPETLKNNPPIDTTITSSVIIKIIKTETILDSINTFVFQETVLENSNMFIDTSYYANLDSGLYFYAYLGPGIVIPKVAHSIRILFKGRYFNSIREVTSYITKTIPQNYILIDSLIYEIPPLQSLKYPMKLGSRWTYRDPGQSWHL